ncbi:MAG: glutathione peroxidase [Pseudomonadales bacterium]|nr:glutathione peroxidase [Pseudomonadales bacterium]
MNLYDLEMESITGDMVSFSDYQGKPLLIVNVASKCGLTPQYAGLKSLHENGPVTVLGFPCNQFGGQEPGTNEEVCEFAKAKFGAEFPMFSKIEVNGDGTCDLYKWLKGEQPNEDGSSDIQWNFTKFLIGPDGKVLKRFGPRTTPEEIEEALGEFL